MQGESKFTRALILQLIYFCLTKYLLGNISSYNFLFFNILILIKF